MDYPQHIYEKIREEAAVSYFRHELRKIFPSIENLEAENLMTNRELDNPRDFWNGLHGISMGFKLKNLIYLITAENISWQKKRLKTDEIVFGVELTQTKIIREGKIPAREFREFYEKNPEVRAQQLKEVIKLRGNNDQRENDPIIAIQRVENGRPVISVHDGNGRLSRHILEEKFEIETYLGIMDGNRPENFWLPTSVIMDYLYFIYLAIKENNNELFNAQIKALKYMLSFSESGKYEFINRALTAKQPERERILKAIK